MGAEFDKGGRATPIAYRIADLWPKGGNVLLAAQFKSGRTTMRDNLVRSLADGDPFLDRFKTTRVRRTVAILDLEMNVDSAWRWLRDQSIATQERVRLVVFEEAKPRSTSSTGRPLNGGPRS
jgi:hypothetical protein